MSAPEAFRRIYLNEAGTGANQKENTMTDTITTTDTMTAAELADLRARPHGGYLLANAAYKAVQDGDRHGGAAGAKFRAAIDQLIPGYGLLPGWYAFEQLLVCISDEGLAILDSDDPLLGYARATARDCLGWAEHELPVV